MKRLLPLPALCGALLAILPTAPSACAQTGVITWAQSYGVATYDKFGQPTDDYTGDDHTAYRGSGIDRPAAIAPMPDGGVVVAGQLGLFELQAGESVGTSAALVRYAKDGTILWQTLLRQNNDDTDISYGLARIAHCTVYRMRADAAGNIFVCGGLENVASGGPTPFAAKFSPDGALVWQNEFDGVNFNGPNPDGTLFHATDGGLPFQTMDLTSDGGVILGGTVVAPQTYNAQDGRSVPFILKFNADGSAGFHHEYDGNGFQYSSVISVCERPGGVGYALLLPPNPTNPVNSSHPAVVVVLTDTTGNPVGQRTFYGAVPQSITRSADGGLFFLSALDAANGGGSQVHKLNATDLTPIWQTQIHNFTGSDVLTPSADGGCLLAGDLATAAYGGPNGFASVVLLTVDGSGSLVSAPVLGGPNTGKGETVPLYACVTTDGNPAFVATTFSYEVDLNGINPDWWVVRADANGKVIGFTGTMLNAPLSFFAAGPSNEAASFASSDYSSAQPTEDDPSLDTGAGASLVLENLATETGIDLPTVKFQATPATSYNHPVFFGGEAPLGSGVYYLAFPSGNPFGYYGYLSDPSFVYHIDLGYEYVFDANDAGHGVYLYDFASGGFFYTSPVFPFPYLYDFSLNSTVYYYPDPNNPGRYNTNGVRYFYEFANGQIISK